VTTTDIVTPTGALATVEIIHTSPRGTYAAVKLAGTRHRGTVDVFHVATGKRATPPRHFAAVGTQKVAKALADDLDAYDPVNPDGTLRVERDAYHQHIDDFVKGLA
jgi:hypothetical protein